MPYIELSGKTGKGYRTLVDKDIYDAYNYLNWHMNDSGYALRKGNDGAIRLHRLIMNAPEGMVVDHLNGNRLDNRRSNLRITTQKENVHNRKNTRGYTWDKSKGKWMVRYKNKFYGRYTTEVEAAKAYKLACSGVRYLKREHRKNYFLPTGVSKPKGSKKYTSKAQIKGKTHYLGTFETKEEAKIAYDNIIKEKRQCQEHQSEVYERPQRT